MKYHYTYLITNLHPLADERYYIGVHSGITLPDNDIGYMSSSKYIHNDIKTFGKENFEKIIIEEFTTRLDAELHEIKLHSEYNVASNAIFYNRANQLNNGFSTYGNAAVAEKRVKSIIKCWENKSTNEISAHAAVASKISAVTWSMKTQQEKDIIFQKVAAGNKLHWKNKSQEDKDTWSSKFKEIWNNKSLEEKQAQAIRASKATKGKKWYTNGKIRKRCFLDDEPPGFVLGHKINV
jgi:hypothetical protein